MLVKLQDRCRLPGMYSTNLYLFRWSIEAIQSVQDFDMRRAQAASGELGSQGTTGLLVMSIFSSKFTPSESFSTTCLSRCHTRRSPARIISWNAMQYKGNTKETNLPQLNLLWVAKRFQEQNSTMAQRYVRLPDSIKFSFYWIALVASSLIVFMSAASHMQVKPLQFQAPTGSLDDVFSPDVVFSDFLMASLLTQITR